MSSSLGVPVKLLFEAQGLSVTVELKNGELYRGDLDSVESTMSCQLKKATHTARDGKVTKLEHVYIRGSQVKFYVLPDQLKDAPLFKKVQEFSSAKAKPFSAPKPKAGIKRPRE